MPTSASQVNTRFETACRIAPIHRQVTSGSARATMPPAKPPISVAARPTPLTIVGVVVAREAEIDHERRRHRAGERVAELEQHHEGEHDDRHVAGEEFGERAGAPP